MLLKKALIITYYWPPSGGGGVQRWLKFSKYLHEFGWQPIIYTPENPDFELRDESLSKDILPETEVIKRPIWEPYKLYRKLLGKKAVQQQGVVSGESKSLIARFAIWFRGNYFIPDARVFWVRPSVNFLMSYLKKVDLDIIITTGPPHSLHLIGLELSKRTQIKWAADFRDPWSEWDVLDLLHLTNRSKRNHRKLEQKVLQAADLVIATSPSTARSLARLGAKRTALITNGFDDEANQSGEQAPQRFRIAHIGLLNKARNPERLWQTLDEMCSTDNEFYNNLEIFLAGTIDQDVLDLLGQYQKLADRIVLVGYLPHEEVIKEYKKSAVLLLLVNNTSNANLIIPAKLFEYLKQKRPVLSFGAPDSDVSVILEESGFEGCLAYDDEDSIKELVGRYYAQFKQMDYTIPGSDIAKFSRKMLTKELAQQLDTVL